VTPRCVRPPRTDHCSAALIPTRFWSTARDDDMAHDTPPPKDLPEPGYYYHFKHGPDGPRIIDPDVIDQVPYVSAPLAASSDRRMAALAHKGVIPQGESARHRRGRTRPSTERRVWGNRSDLSVR
jgi:hypothetical protein